MSQPLSITLRALGEAAAAAAGTAVDIGAARSAARLRISCTAGPPVRLVFETSADGVGGWLELDAITVEPGESEISVAYIKRFLRVRWELGAGAAPATFGVDGDAHQVYCGPRDIARFGIREAALHDITTPSARADACITVSAEADGYLGGRYVLPLVAWDDDLRAQCARMAARYSLDACGWQPDGPDHVIETAFDRALTWLKRLQAGQLEPPGIIDSTPEQFEGGSVVVSRPRRTR